MIYLRGHDNRPFKTGIHFQWLFGLRIIVAKPDVRWTLHWPFMKRMRPYWCVERKADRNEATVP